MAWILFVTLAVWFYLLFRVLFGKRMEMANRIEAAVASKSGARGRGTAAGRREARPSRMVLGKLSVQWIRKQPASRLSATQAKLAQAGYPFQLSAPEWIGFKLLCVGVGLIVGVVVLLLSGGQLAGFAVLLGCLLFGFVGPEFWLSRQVTQRQAAILKQLPGMMDLLTVSVEAGLGFDQALARVAEKSKGPLAEEMERMQGEIQMGNSRASALTRMATRVGVEELRSFAAAVTQAEKLGVSMAPVLRVQALDMRRRRRMDAQERAMKAPVKLLFPLILFVFPALFIVILGPALLNILQYFGHGV